MPLILLLLLLFGRAGASAGPAPDPLERRTLAELRTFTDWLAANEARGYVGEVGWPDDSKGDATAWNDLADRWYSAADAAGLWVDSWGTGEWWGTYYKLAPYENAQKHDGVDRADTQAPVLEAHLRSFGYRRGVSVNGGEFGSPISRRTSGFSNQNPGRYDTRYHYDRQGTFDFLAARGLDHVRIPFRWERIQRELEGPLEEDEVERLRAVIRRAEAAGLTVVLDMHNYGAYYLYDGNEGVRRAIGSAQVSPDAFADAWGRISRAFKDEPAVLAYALMAEPYNMPRVGDLAPARVWERASQAAVDAIRANGDETMISVAGYGWDAIQVFTKHHPRAWIEDAANATLYEVHHYWDGNHSGDYARTYDAEVEKARRQGW